MDRRELIAADPAVVPGSIDLCEYSDETYRLGMR
jgi:hypothetical protein